MLVHPNEPMPLDKTGVSNINERLKLPQGNQSLKTEYCLHHKNILIILFNVDFWYIIFVSGNKL